MYTESSDFGEDSKYSEGQAQDPEQEARKNDLREIINQKMVKHQDKITKYANQFCSEHPECLQYALYHYLIGSKPKSGLKIDTDYHEIEGFVRDELV